MAANWIKMRTDLLTHPKVVRISSALNADRLRVVGALWAVWSLFDAHSEDGELEGYTFQLLDDMLGWPGFSTAMAAVGWLEAHAQVLVAPRFDAHNGQSAKRRAQESERKRDVRKVSASDADKKRTREEKRREEREPPNPPAGGCDGFDEFIAEFPESRRVKTEEARREFVQAVASGEVTAQQLVLAMRQQSAAQGKLWQHDGGRSCPAPARWLREQRWRDGRGTQPGAWSETRAGIESMGERLGLGAWDEAAFNQGQGEAFPVYERRVRAAVEAAGQTSVLNH